MESTVYLLVCEGPTDIIVIKKIAKVLSTQLGKQIEIREISPQRDATTHRYPDHGWEEVKQWCQLYGETSINIDNPFAQIAAKSRNWKTLIAMSRAEGLIIQIDTDIAEQIIIDDMPVYRGDSKNSRKHYCRKSLLYWLGENTIPDNIHFILSTYSTETWLLSTHNRTEDVFENIEDNFDFEDIANPQDYLISLGYSTYSNHTGSGLKLSKDLSLYSRYADSIASNLETVSRECEEVQKFTTYLSR